MTDKNSLKAFIDAPIYKAVLSNAIPAMLAMIMVLVYNLADTFFIGQTHDDLQVAAVSLATPVFLIFMALGTVFGIGGTSVISRAKGEGNDDYAKKVSSFCMYSCIIVGIALAIVLLIFMDEILLLCGASADTWEYAKIYLTIVSFSGPFVLISNCYSNIIRAEGQSTKAMMGQVIGNLLNVVLDPIMILAFKWDIAGAAIATVIGNIAGAMYYIIYFLKGESTLSISIKDFTLKEGTCFKVLSIGIPASLGSLLMSISQIMVNGMMTSYGDMALAGIGVAMKVTMITSMICIGFAQGVQPLLGYCVGANLQDRFKKVMKFSLIFSFALSVTMTGLCYIFTESIVSVFLSDLEALSYGIDFSRILLSTSFLFGIFYVFVNALQAIGAATPALIINISRQGLIYIPALFIMESMIGINGLLWAQPVADILSTILVVVLYRHTILKMNKDNY